MWQAPLCVRGYYAKSEAGGIAVVKTNLGRIIVHTGPCLVKKAYMSADILHPNVLTNSDATKWVCR
jgi:hypothetical protein